VATVLLAAEALRDADGVAVLITSAEELGLAGARAFAAAHARSAALNCDTVDDRAPLISLAAGGSGQAAEALVRGGARAGTPVRRRALLPGILVDGVAFADARWECATLSAATWGTLTRVHTPRDSLANLEGQGVARAAGVLAAAVVEWPLIHSAGSA
jgi:hypothetical protein